MLSLVVPTYNRPFFLERLLRYYAELRFSHAVVVADSSSGRALEENHRLIASVQGTLNIAHRVFPADTGPYEKLALTIGPMESKFVAICADDDFIVPAGLASCVDFLEANPDHAIAHGHSTAVLIAEGGDAGRQSEIRGALTYPQRTIDSDNPAERLVDHLGCYTATYYSVHRRLQLVKNLQRASDYTIDYRFGELLSSCLSILHGKAKCLDVMYMVRQAELGPATKKYSEKMLPWDALLLLADFPERYTKFSGCLTEELVAVSGISTRDAQAVVAGAFRSYLAQNLSGPLADDEGDKNRLYRATQRAYRVIKTLPAATRMAIDDREFLRMIRAPRSAYREALSMSDEMSLPALLNTRSPFHEQFMKVYKYLKPGTNGFVSETQREQNP